MSDTVVKVENVSKRYLLGERSPYKSIRESVMNTLKIPFHLARSVFGLEEPPSMQDFWALKDVSFELKRGEVLGLIGRNGSGKSTLLKILSRITEPTTGRIELNGRVGSLLEVGTGFHPELTGRENVFFNGSILGMSKAEISKKFDEIVAFSGVEKFLDTPVKHYSSGMYMRLAFSVAAHLEPEILLVDEVLAVGDAEFQKKCLGKMDDVAKQGRTVIFVSHNMQAVQKLCSKCILIEQGQVKVSDTVSRAIDLYLDNALHSLAIIEKNRDCLQGNQFVSIFNYRNHGVANEEFRHDEDINVFIEMYLPNWHKGLELSLSVYDKHRRRIFTYDVQLKDYYQGNPFLKMEITIPSGFLTVGQYSWLMSINLPKIQLYDLQDGICDFKILETGSVFSKYQGLDFGIVYPPECTVRVIT
jgi:lipopolysaccharide transport system ATP-binding protein